MGKSNIQWTDYTWNIARGCTKVDEDCRFCYMYRDSFDNSRYNPLEVRKTKTVFDLPLRIAVPSKIFTCSLTDFFHEAIDPYRHEAWDIIRRCPQHTYQILTKRPERIVSALPDYWDKIYGTVWLGTSIGSQAAIHRLHQLVTPVMSGVRFLSLEPLWGPIDLQLDQLVDMGHKLGSLIDWVIIGGESGNETGKYRYRPCELSWMRSIVDQCKAFDIPVFVKQMGTYLAKELNISGDRHGSDINQFPADLQIREFPKIYAAQQRLKSLYSQDPFTEIKNFPEML